ncbi:MalY/PatB family protein [Metabacillus fastidiosus]|uniref:cysteine-S-conjugate beta-lyase n=1 Tax=Metabacillus fastidiosus TaxID=1458 RepID=A0ABU6P105_9BACI|nr:pyridoxal phosphate-dependent aminotransferase [Metabacillus fastidiosus]
MYNFDKIIDRKNSKSVKWDFTKDVFGTDDVLPMWVADMDFPAPEEVIKAMKERVEHGIFGYTKPTKLTAEIIQNWLARRHNWKIQAKEVTYSPGIVTALGTAILAYTERGDHIVIQPPVYHPFFEMVKKNDRQLLYNNLSLHNGRYEINFDDLENKLADERAKLFILCSPHNPSGRVWSKEELTKIITLCVKHNVIIVSDEIHSDILLFDNHHTPIASIPYEHEVKIITCIAPSKTFNIAGLQASALIIQNDSLRRRFVEVQRSQGLTSLNIFAVTAMEAAYQYGGNWLDELITYLEQNVLFVKSYLEKHFPEIKVIIPEASYLIWLDIRELGINDEEVRKLLLRKGKLALESGSKYGEPGEGFLRINVGCPKSTLEEGMKRLVSAFS